ncbi:MAG: hypothetical protein KDE26_22770 [Bacteroidetes bacterium]|nr:hypothetical protein [Bacteroidota bacterium]MCB0846100.1 hypothetical protein [Bacteroidota bacterium]
MKSFFVGLILTLLYSGTLLAQITLHIDASCSFTGTLSEEQIYGFASDNEAKAALDRIMRYTGLPANFNIQAANVPNAAAAIYGSKRYILYSQYFMQRIKDQTRTDWSAVSILAHEIGHHLSGHTLDNIGSRPNKELEADKFSGFILYKMGATLEEARVAMENVATDEGSDTHPSKSGRLAAITNGWIEAQQLDKGGKAEPEKNIISKSGVRSDNKKDRDKSPLSPAEIAENAKLEVEDVRVEHNVYEGNVKGMKIHLRFTVYHMQGKECYVSAQFFHQSGQRLIDQNGKYFTTNGYVATREKFFTPSYDASTFKEMTLFLPSTELHLGDGKFRLKFHVGFFYEGYQIGLSDFVNFVAD